MCHRRDFSGLVSLGIVVATHCLEQFALGAMLCNWSCPEVTRVRKQFALGAMLSNWSCLEVTRVRKQFAVGAARREVMRVLQFH